MKFVSYSCEHSLGERGGWVALDIELGYTRDADSPYGDPSKLNWFQTYCTNYVTDSTLEPPTNTDIQCVVDPRGNDTTAKFYNEKNGSVLRDDLHRPSLEDRPVYWRAETSAVGISDEGLTNLGTAEWGFEMFKDGRLKRRIPLQVVTPSGFHSGKLEELQANYKGQ